MALLTPARRPLLLPGTTKRALRRPDARGLIVPELSGAPLSAAEIDYDDLEILRTWREYEPAAPGQVRYFCYELRQTEPGAETDVFFKAVRLIRLTRVPRYLKQGTGQHGPNAVFEQMRDVLVGLREKRVLFLNMIAKSPQLPLVFAYGVQGTGDTLADAKRMADEGHAALTYSLDGTYQQLEYAPLKLEEGELLARYQAEWGHISMARGRPMPVGSSLGTSAILDGNRTDADATNNQLEAFIRGMGDKSFMLSLVTVPLAPADMTSAWRNIAQKLSAVRSDQQGQRSVSAGIALPLGLGASLGDGSGTTHGVTGTSGLGTSDGHSASIADSVGASHSAGTSYGHSVTATDGTSAGATHSAGTSTALGQSVGTSDSVAHGQSTQVGTGVSDSVSVSHGQSAGQSTSETQGVSAGQSLSRGETAGSNWSSSVGQSMSAGQTLTDGLSKGFSDALSQAWSLGNTHGDGVNGAGTTTSGSGVNAGLFGVGGNNSTGTSQTQGQSQSNSDTIGLGQTNTGTASTGISQSMANSLSQGVNLGESQGGSLAQSLTATNSVGTSHSVGVGQSLGTTDTLGRSAGTSSSMAQGQSLSTGQSLSQGANLTHGASDGLSVSNGQSASLANGVNAGVNSTDGVSASQTSTSGASTALSQQQAMSDAYMVAMSRQASTTGSLGIAPNFGVSFSRATFDESKRVIGDILESQMKRYQEGLEGGGLLYQMFLVSPDRETLVGASSLLKAAFWGPGGDSDRLPQPFHTVVIDDEEEAGRLLTHAAAFTSYRRREPVSELIEPWLYSSYVSAGEAAAFVHPPTAEALGIQANVDSMPVLRMPFDRADRDMYLGRIVNGERGRVSDARFGLDLDELTHILVQGVTGSGKTTTVMRLLEQASRLSRVVVSHPTPANPVVTTTVAHAGVLALDWMRNMRDLANVVPADRFQLFSVAQPELGAFRWNPLEIPHVGMDPGQWLGAQADNLAASFGLGEYGRSILAEIIDDLYKMNRLEDHELLKQVEEPDTGAVLRRGFFLEAVDGSTLPPEAISVDGAGKRYANVYSYPELSRLVGLNHVAAIVCAKIEMMATPEGGRLFGTAMRDRLQSLWRRIQYYAPGKAGAAMVAPDPDLATRECLGVADIIDPDRGLVTVIETDGLDLENRRVILGSVMLAVYRYGLHVGKGAFDHGGRGPGTFVVLEEAHELFGEAGEGEDRTSATMRATLYESLFRRARATGLRLVPMTQNCGALPAAITSQTSTVIVHRSYDPKDRERIFSLLNWSNMVGQQLREWRWLGEMPTRGWCIVRLDARDSYLESAPVQLVIDPPGLPPVGDDQLRALAAARAAARS